MDDTDQPYIGALAVALARAQGELRNPIKGNKAEIETKGGRKYSYLYADLPTGLDVIRPVLSKHEICFVQRTRVNGDLLMLDTDLIHSSGASLHSEWPVCKLLELTPQQVGIALTYARRYSLFAIVGVAGDDDDDGAAASQQPADQQAPERTESASRYLTKAHEWLDKAKTSKEVEKWWMNPEQKNGWQMLDNYDRKDLVRSVETKLEELRLLETSQQADANASH